MTPPTREPFYFGGDERPLFGWLHHAGDGARLGLVVVPPFGYEAICAHRSLRHIAEAATNAGVPTVRFDLDGTGDSAGDDRDPRRVAAWIASIGHAADALRRATGVERVCLLGVRTGALLAAAAAAARDDIAGLAVIAPVVSGRAWVREMKALQMALGLAEPPPGTPSLPEGEQEAVGFRLTAETRDALSKLELLKADRRPAPEVLVIDRDDMPPTDKWATHLRGLGAAVTQRREPGYVDMVADPHKTKIPEAMIAAATAWLRELAAKAPPPGNFKSETFPLDRMLYAGEQPAKAPLETSAHMGGIVERAVFLGGERGLFGVLAAPAAGVHRRAILLLNAGGVHHVGPNRLYVAFARRWAALGHLVLRLDIAGIGDSPPRPGEPENIVYAARTGDDIAAAVAYLRAQPGVTDVCAAGLCSGAYNAFKAAVRGEPLTAVVPINPLTFFWKDGMEFIDPGADAPFKVAAEAQRYAASVRDPEKWKKLLRGEVDFRALAQVLARRGASLLARHGRDLARRIGRPLPDDLGAELETIARRGVRLTFVFSTNDPGLDMLRVQGGSSVPSLSARGALRWEVIEGPDHTFTALWTHAVLAERLSAILEGPVPRP